MSRSRVRICVMAVLTLLVGASCDRAVEPNAEPPNVLLILIDTLRADRVGAHGSERSLTPSLDRLAARGTVFTNAYSTSSWTLPAIASLFTSRYQSQHRITSYLSRLTDEELTLAEKLGESGYRSVGFSANLLLGIELGYAQGFARWKTYPGERHNKDMPYLRARFMRERVLRWIDANWSPASPPSFLYVHYMEPHSPYNPPERFRSPETTLAAAHVANRKVRTLQWADIAERELELLESLYDGEIAYVDREVDTLLAELAERHFLEDAIVIVTSDHGEEFREHGLLQHGSTLYEESVRIPLIVLAPGYEGGRVVEQPVSLLDLAPTILELAGLPAERRFEGRSLVPLLEAEHDPERGPVVLELASKGEEQDARVHERAVIGASAKLLIDPSGQRVLFELGSDPGESRPQPGDGSTLARELVASLEHVLADAARRASAPAELPELSEEHKERLRSLGYLDSR